jgi:prepilin-type N-terminal cleavage/methylation domain-containing protein
MKKYTGQKNGFTLIELIITISIIFLLVSVTSRSIISAQIRAQDARTKSDVAQIQFAVEVYYHEFGGYPNPQGITPNGDQIYCIGTTECIFQNISHTGIPPLVLNNIQPHVAENPVRHLLAAALNIIPHFSSQNLGAYTFNNGAGGFDTYAGYFYKCTVDPSDPNNATNPICIGTARMYYALNSPTGIKEYIFGTTSNTPNAVIPGAGDCPDPSPFRSTCEQGAIPPVDVQDIDPYNGGGSSGTTHTVVNYESGGYLSSLGSLAPYGQYESGGACAIQTDYPPRTVWPVGWTDAPSDMTATKTFTLPVGANNVRVYLAVDNYLMNMTFNGTTIVGSQVPFSGCADHDERVYSIPNNLLNTGATPNTISYTLRDEGYQSYFDAKITADY